MTSISRARMAAGLLAIAAAGHGVAVAHHADARHGGVLLGAGFSAVAVSQLVAATALARRPPENRLRQLVVGGTVALVALWAASRTVGLPVGPYAGRVEAVGGLDALTVAAQLGVVGLLVRQRRRGISIAFASSFAVAVVGAAALHIAGATTTVGGKPHSHSEADARQSGRSGSSDPLPPSREDPARGRGVDHHAHDRATHP